jgi:hypothetical protein
VTLALRTDLSYVQAVTRRVRVLLASGVAALLFAAAPTARAIPFGADLNLPANVGFDCTVIPSPPAFGNGFVVLPSGQPTCTWAAIGTIANPKAGTFLVPVAGTVTQVAVRVGPVTGPMQVVVMRAFRDQSTSSAPTVCCTEAGRTPVFTPTPNAVTTIATALAVRKDVIPDPINNTLTFDSLALSVLAPNVPIPAFDVGDHNPGNFGIPQSVVFHPAVAPGQERFLNSGVGGFQVLMAADVAPSQSGAGPTPAPGGAAPAAIVGRTATVRNGAAPVLIRCTLATGRCTGTLLLQNGAQAAARGKAKKVTYGRAAIDIAAGKRQTLQVKLTRAGKRLLRKKSKPKVWINASVGGEQVAATRVTLKKPPRKKR